MRTPHLDPMLLARRAVLLCAALVLTALSGSAGVREVEREGSGPIALRARKILTMAESGPEVIDNGVLLSLDGRIVAVGPASQVEVPEEYVVIDVGERWLMPGLVELHHHSATGQLPFPADINDMVYLANPGLRVSATVVPGNSLLKRGIAGGVTSALFIPGSGTNIGGQGVLLKLGEERYEDMELRNPGSMKLAQSGNPERFTIGVGRSFMNWHTRNTLRRGKNYHAAWKAFEEGRGPRPEKNPQWEIFRALFDHETQVSVHTQIYQVVLMTITMVRMEFGLDAYIDHGSFDGYKTAELAEREGVPAILGPRMIQSSRPPFIDQDGQIRGIAAEYQKRGHTNVGFNTDCVDGGAFITPPQEELQLQAGMAVRYGFDDSELQAVKGLTIVPARAAGLDHRLGSLEVGKDADVVVIGGHPADPRNAVEMVLTNGRVVYDAERDGRRW